MIVTFNGEKHIVIESYKLHSVAKSRSTKTATTSSSNNSKTTTKGKKRQRTSDDNDVDSKKAKVNTTSCYLVVNCNDTEQCYVVSSDDCTDELSTYDDGGVYSYICAFLRRKHCHYQYSYFGFGEMQNAVHMDFDWYFDYKGKERKVDDICKIMDDGILCDVDGEYRHFKFDVMEQIFLRG